MDELLEICASAARSMPDAVAASTNYAPASVAIGE
jgi:hypothetical protein